MIKEENIHYLNNLIRNILEKEIQCLGFEKKNNNFYLYVSKHFASIDKEYRNLACTFDPGQEINYFYNGCNFWIKIDKPYRGSYDVYDFIPFKCYIDNVRKFMNEFNIEYKQIESAIHYVINEQKEIINKCNKKITNANKKLDEFKDFLNIPLEFL